MSEPDPSAVRATVRYRLDPPPPPGQPPLTDAVGEVLRNAPDEIVLATRAGLVRIPRALVVATRIIPATPPRRGVVAGNIEPLHLHRLVADSWPAMETGQLGDWLLRASRGFTARGNSVLPVGDPGIPNEQAVDWVERWYAERRLPADVTLAGPAGFDPARDPLGALLIEQGYAVSDPSLFLTAKTATVAAWARAVDPSDAIAFECSGELTREWLTAYDGYRTGDRGAARAILTGSPEQVFVAAREGEHVIGVGRLGRSGDWGGIAAMWVDPAYRRRGVASGLVAAAAHSAQDRGVGRLHLQVWARNAAARALYRRAGFVAHHAYVNLRSGSCR